MLRHLSTLHGFFPGQDWRNAHAVGQRSEWAGPNRGCGRVSRQGIAWWRDIDAMYDDATPEIWLKGLRLAFDEPKAARLAF